MVRFFDLTFAGSLSLKGSEQPAPVFTPFGPGGQRGRRENPFVPDYTIITQHWGIMVGLMGSS